jgi:hypothetical protein
MTVQDNGGEPPDNRSQYRRPDPRSEYEELLAHVAPHLGGVSAANLSEEDIERIARESGSNRGQLESLQVASALAPRLGYAVAVLYGIDRVQPGLSAERLAQMAERRRRELLMQAIEENLVPAELRGYADEAVRPTPPTGEGTAPVAPPAEAPPVEYPPACTYPPLCKPRCASAASIRWQISAKQAA